MSQLVSFDNLIGNRTWPAAKTFESFDPFLGSPWAAIPRCGEKEVRQAVAAAKAAFEESEWPAMNASARGLLLWRLADLIAQNAVIPFEGLDDALAIANDTPFGLAAGVWTSDMQKAFIAIERLQVGTVRVNSYRTVSYVAPFGGYRRSGLGRENGQEANDAYLQTKTVWIDPASRAANPFVLR